MQFIATFLFLYTAILLEFQLYVPMIFVYELLLITLIFFQRFLTHVM